MAEMDDVMVRFGAMPTTYVPLINVRRTEP
jgi:hypothetical protein